jgi:CRP/FNR family transcriptional regulator
MTIIERVLLLQSLEFFGGVTTEQLSFIAMIAEEVSVDSESVLYKENDPPSGLYVVISGAVAVTRNGQLIERVGPSGSLGIWALFDDQPRLTAAKAVEPSQLLFVPREDFYDVLSDHVDMIQGVFKQLVERVRRLATVVDK